jgi:hypothetical protein
MELLHPDQKIDRDTGTATTLMVVVIFSLAMAALESAVVVYLRALYYPDGFTVAFRLIDRKIVTVELLRELATLIMLWSVSFLTGKNRRQRFAYFLIAFAVWDLAYYGWLKVFLDWPSTLFEWDILFLIPFTWLGPVLAPVICSLTMIGLAAALLLGPVDSRTTPPSVLLIAAGSLVILYTFLFDYGSLLWTNDLFTDYAGLLDNKKFISLASTFQPASYNWPLFWFGDMLLWIAIAILLPLPAGWQQWIRKQQL